MRRTLNRTCYRSRQNLSFIHFPNAMEYVYFFHAKWKLFINHGNPVSCVHASVPLRVLMTVSVLRDYVYEGLCVCFYEVKSTVFPAFIACSN